MKFDSMETREIVLQVHGTFAARSEDRGNSWWQVGSSAYERLRRRLPQNIAIAEPGEVFHWSGENSERARIKGGASLFARLKELEKRGQYYHLIGHSHGGSVIWHALRMATLNRVELKFMRSWTTVGTPFFRHALPRVARLSNILRMVLGLILIKPACLTALKFFDLLFRPQSSVWLGHGTLLPKKFTLYDTPVLRILELMNVPMERGDGHIRIEALTPGGERFDALFLLTSPTGWLLVFMALIVITVYLNLSVFVLRPVIESWQVWAESRLERHARDQFASRWLGLWSPDDEAINGLKATLELSVSFVSRMGPRDRILLSDYATITMQPYYWAMTPLFNWLLHPSLDRLVRSIVIKSAQGNNRPGTEVVEVGPIPWKSEPNHTSAPLPQWLNDRLVQNANESAAVLVPKLRELLAAPSFTTSLSSLGKSGGTISELVHTSNFEHDEIIDLLAMHIAGSCCMANWHRATEDHFQLAVWLADAKSRVGCSRFEMHINSQPRLARISEASRSERVRPRRRTNDAKAA